MLTPRTPTLLIEPSILRKHVCSLKNNKAPDPFGVAAEHLKHAHDSITPVLTSITNRILEKQTIPDDLKLGMITPVPKKQKDKHNPDSYRRITVNSMYGKIVEKVMVPHTRSALKPNSSRNQFGFKESISCTNAAVLLTEIEMDAKDCKTPAHIAFMDTSKAFDMVDHSDLLCTLHQQGVTGALWNLYDSSYTNKRSIVKWQMELSREIHEGQGIHQGGLTSADAFNGKSDPLLNKLSCEPEGYTIGTTNVGAIMVADDLMLAAKSQTGLQLLVNMAEQDASAKRYIFSTTKTKVQAPKAKQPTHIELNGAPLENSSEETHLGIDRRVDLSNKSTVQSRVQTGRRTLFMLMGAGVYGLNGVNPRTSMKLINTYVMPRMTYGLECLTLSSNEIDPLEQYYRSLLKDIQHLPTATANPACYLLLGALPIEGHIHIKTLSLFGNIMRREDSIEYEVLERQLAVKDINSNSWAIHVKKLLSQYGLPRPIQLLYSMCSKTEWKKCVKSHVTSYWFDQLRDAASRMVTLTHLNLDACHVNDIHPVWDTNSTDPIITHRAAIHTKILVQRYQLYTSHTSRQSTNTCPCCKTADETLLHFIIECKVLAPARIQTVPTIIAILQTANIPTDPVHLLQAVLDASKLTLSPDVSARILPLARTLCFNLHLRRLPFTEGSHYYSSRPKSLSAAAIKRTRSILTYREPSRPGASPNGREIKTNE